MEMYENQLNPRKSNLEWDGGGEVEILGSYWVNSKGEGTFALHPQDEVGELVT